MGFKGRLHYGAGEPALQVKPRGERDAPCNRRLRDVSGFWAREAAPGVPAFGAPEAHAGLAHVIPSKPAAVSTAPVVLGRDPGEKQIDADDPQRREHHHAADLGRQHAVVVVVAVEAAGSHKPASDEDAPASDSPAPPAPVNPLLGMGDQVGAAMDTVLGHPPGVLIALRTKYRVAMPRLGGHRAFGRRLGDGFGVAKQPDDCLPNLLRVARTRTGRFAVRRIGRPTAILGRKQPDDLGILSILLRHCAPGGRRGLPALRVDYAGSGRQVEKSREAGAPPY